MQCREFREIADSYLSNELIVETNHDVISHLENCADCRRELAARRELRGKLRAAFINSPTNQLRPEFADRLSAQLRTRAMQTRGAHFAEEAGWRSMLTPRRASWLAVAACLIVAGAFGLVLLRQRISQRSRPNETAQQQQPGSKQIPGEQPALSYSPQTNPQTPVKIVKTELAKSAAGDHRDCAVHFRLPEKPIALEEAGRKYDPTYINLTKAVFSERNGEQPQFQVVEAHSCVFEGRRFAHIVLRYHDRLVSFLVTDVDRSAEAKASAPRSLDPQHQVIACSQFDGYQVSCFETARHAVFIVSDLSEGQNLALARALAPSVFEHITRTENPV